MVALRMDDARGEKPKWRYEEETFGPPGDFNNPFAPKAATQAVVFGWCVADIAPISSTSIRLMMKSLWRF